MKMKLSTFCVLLASGLMLMSAMIVGFIRTERQGPEEAAVSSIMKPPETGAYLLTVNGRAAQTFGAKYSETLGQWSGNEEMIVEINEDGRIEACGDLYVGRIERGAEGVCVWLKAEETEISVWPVNNVRVFAGSRMKDGDVIAEAAEQLFISARRNGCAENPERFLRLTDG